MNLDELRTVQSKERRKDSLQQLRDSFYEDAAASIEERRAARDRRAEQVSNPFSDDEIRRMSDEIETAEEVAEALYERRVGKVVKLASFAAAEMPVDDEGMTSHERALFEDLVARIRENKTTVLDILAGEEPATPTTDSEGPTTGSEGSGTETDDASGGLLADAMGTDDSPVEQSRSDGTDHAPVDPEPAPDGIPPEIDADSTHRSVATAADDATAEHDESPSSDPTDADAVDTAPEVAADPGGDHDGRDDPDDRSANESNAEAKAEAGTSAPDTERTTLRITADVGEIFGVDEREYCLEREDVVSLPVANADPLVERGAAERLD
ncbi:hypothetical protein ACNS7O_00640 [Haloferacaceae archaeon DSL9]